MSRGFQFNRFPSHFPNQLNPPGPAPITEMDLIAKAVTLKSIKLNDPTAQNLLFSAKHAVLYSFSSAGNSWEKTETEGCLAIYRRNGKAGKAAVLFILNRLRPENFSCPLAQIENAQLEGDLLMLLLKNTQVMGIWLFDEQERQLALNVLKDLLEGNSATDQSDEEEEEKRDKLTNENVQLKHISVTDLLGGGKNLGKSPSILDLLAKAKVNEESQPKSLDDSILKHFQNSPVPASLKSFTNSVCQLLQSNPQLLAALHRQSSQQQDRNKQE